MSDEEREEQQHVPLDQIPIELGPDGQFCAPPPIQVQTNLTAVLCYGRKRRKLRNIRAIQFNYPNIVIIFSELAEEEFRVTRAELHADGECVNSFQLPETAIFHKGNGCTMRFQLHATGVIPKK